MGAGIIPIAFHNGKIYFLFGREYIKAKNSKGEIWKHAGMWSDFGGAKEKNETYEETAIRECFEETGGFLCSKNHLQKLIKTKLIKSIYRNGYTTFIVSVDYDERLPKIFRAKFLSIEKKHPELICKHGLYEKDMIKWFSFEDIKKDYNKFRPWFKFYLLNILKSF